MSSNRIVFFEDDIRIVFFEEEPQILFLDEQGLSLQVSSISPLTSIGGDSTQLISENVDITFSGVTTSPTEQTSVLAFLPANTWTDFPSSPFEVVNFQIFDENGTELTDAFEYRKIGSQYQLRSFSDYFNLTFELESE